MLKPRAARVPIKHQNAYFKDAGFMLMQLAGRVVFPTVTPWCVAVGLVFYCCPIPEKRVVVV